MKRNKILLFVLMALFLLVTVTGCGDKHQHVFGDWELVVAPTIDKEGEATKKCECGEVVTQVVPALSDTSTWNVVVTDSTCTVKGNKKYTSEYGEIVIELPLADHEYGDWTLTLKPTLENVGKATRKCKYGETEEVEVPVLTDTTVWKKVVVDATCTKEGLITYTSVYGKVEVKLEKLPHTYGDWTIINNPTYNQTGTAERTCKNCGYVETKELPVLTDTTVWTLIYEILPTYNSKGKKTYSSIYGNAEIDIQKKIAPYDNKTYYTFAFDAENELTGGFINGKVNVETAWNKTGIKIDSNGQGDGDSHPFRGHIKLNMVDEETGKIEILTYKDNTLKELVSKVYGYVDFETGIIVSPQNNSIKFAQVWTPFESGVNEEKANASSWENSLAIEYTFNKKTYTMYVTEERTYFNTKFADLEGNIIQAQNCYNSPVLYINYKDQLIKTYVYNGEKLVESDGYEGKYSGEQGELTLSGCGTAILNNVKGTYKLVKGTTNYTLDLYLNNEYYELTLKDNTYALNKAMVNVTLNKGEFGETEILNVNKNINLKLPVLTTETHTFKGWFYDELCLEPVEENFIPTKDTTLYAYWLSKVVINISGGLENDPKVLYLGDGDTIGEYLPIYDLDLVNKKQFVGWYLDATFENTLPEDAIVTEADSGFTIYAKWENLPLYFGSYKGAEQYGLESGNSSPKELKIDEKGNITGLKTGKIISYDINTQTILYKEKETDTEANKIYFDQNSLTIAIPYSSGNDLKGDYYFLIQDSKTGLANEKYAINIPNEEGKFNGFYARFLNINSSKGVMDIFVRYNKIYSNVTLTNALGEVLTVNTIKDSRTIVVKDKTSDEVIFAYGTKGINFKEKNDKQSNVILDNYYGSYTSNGNTIILDGIDKVIYGKKEGTYKLVNNNIFDIYLDNNKEYYELILNGKEFTLTKVMVNVNFEVGAGHNQIEAVSVNKNVLMMLPDVTEEGYVFNGWFIDQEFTVPATNFIPTKDTTLYAKFSLPAKLTIVYNNGAENKTIIYSVGDIVDIEKPVYDKFAFVGWYTTPTFDENSLYIMGGTISSDLTIYAKWVEAPLYNNSFGAVEISGTNLHDKSRVSNQGFPSFNENGEIVNTGYYPFNPNTKFVDYDKATMTAKFLKNNTYYHTFMNEEGLIVISQENKNQMDEVWLLAPGETKIFVDRIASSYWLNGMARLIVYTDLNNVKHNIFVYNNNCYFGVTFADLKGNEVQDANNAHINEGGLKVFASNGTLIDEFGFNGTTLTTLDGKQGIYTEGETNIVELDGTCIITLNGIKGTYTLVNDQTYTLTAVVNNSYYEITLVNDTCTVVKPMVEITFDPVGGTINGGLTQSFNINISQKLPVPEKENYAFKGWLDGDVLLPELYTPTVNKNLTATWAEAFYVTFIMNNGAPTEEFPIEKNTVIEMVPTFENHIFLGWYTNDTLTTKYDDSKITGPITLYAKWMNMPTYFGTYNGAEFDDAHVFNNRTLTINPDFTFKSNRYNGTLIPESYNDTTKVINFKDNYNNPSNILFYDKVLEEEFFILNYAKSSYDPISDDFMLYIKGEKQTDVKVFTWNNNISRIGFMYYNETVKMFYVNTNTNEFYGLIKLEDNTGKELTFADLATTNSIVIKDYLGNKVKEFAKDKDDFVLLDGNEGTYTGPLQTIIIDGIKNFQFGDDANALTGTYKVLANGNLKLTFQDRHIIMIKVDQKAHTYVLAKDDTTGSYTCDTDTFVSNGDGTCTYNGVNGTYIYDGYNLYYTINDVTELIILKDDGTFVKKSNKPAISGFKFTSSIFVDDWNNPGNQIEYTVEFIFDDSKQIIGSIKIYPTYEMGETVEYTFTGSMEEYILTLTITSSKDKGKLIICTVENGAITITENGISDFQLKGLKLVNDNFVLPSLMYLVLGKTFVGEIKEFDPDIFENVYGPITITFSEKESLEGTLKIHLWNSPDTTNITGLVKGPELSIYTEDGQEINAIIDNNSIRIEKGLIFFYGYDTINYTLDNLVLITE